MKAADLFCGAGGAAAGLHQAGFEVTGWDIKQGLAYPYDRHIGNALDADLSGFDFVWASPPCQEHSKLRHLHPDKEYECFIERTRDKLTKWGGAWIMENVPRSPLRDTVQLCGSSFGLQVRRHRIFESNIPLIGSVCDHKSQKARGRTIDVSGTGGPRKNNKPGCKDGGRNMPRNLKEGQDAMGIDWMVRSELAQAIPPAYSYYLAMQVIEQMNKNASKK